MGWWIHSQLNAQKEGGPCGDDPVKKVNGRKRHIITDTGGLVLGCYVGPANENDRDGIKPAIDNMLTKYSAVKKIWSDMRYQGSKLKDYINKEYDIDLEIVKSKTRHGVWVHKDTPVQSFPIKQSGFKVEPRRWVVERTFGWLGRSRRLAKEYDFLTQTSQNFIYIAMSKLLLNRLLLSYLWFYNKLYYDKSAGGKLLETIIA